jgi:hypothetical protein
MPHSELKAGYVSRHSDMSARRPTPPGPTIGLPDCPTCEDGGCALSIENSEATHTCSLSQATDTELEYSERRQFCTGMDSKSTRVHPPSASFLILSIPDMLEAIPPTFLYFFPVVLLVLFPPFLREDFGHSFLDSKVSKKVTLRAAHPCTYMQQPHPPTFPGTTHCQTLPSYLAPERPSIAVVSVHTFLERLKTCIHWTSALAKKMH